MLVDVAVDSGLEVDDGGEDAAFEAPSGKDGEEGLDGVEPGRRRRCEVEHPSGVTREPSADLGMLVGGVVVGNRVDDLAPAGWCARRR